MRPTLRLATAGAGAGLNALILLVPAALFGYLPVRDPGLVAAVAAVCVGVAVEIFCWMSASGPLEAASKTDLDWLNWMQGLALLASFEIDSLWRCVHPGAGGGWLVMGLGLLVCGALLRAAAILQLGSGFTNASMPGNPVLCVDGIYGRLRHPAELGLCLMVVGFAVALQVWIVAAVTLPLFLILSIIRVVREDRELARAFPDAFAAYRRRVRI